MPNNLLINDGYSCWVYSCTKKWQSLHRIVIFGRLLLPPSSSGIMWCICRFSILPHNTHSIHSNPYLWVNWYFKYFLTDLKWFLLLRRICFGTFILEFIVSPRLWTYGSSLTFLIVCTCRCILPAHTRSIVHQLRVYRPVPYPDLYNTVSSIPPLHNNIRNNDIRRHKIPSC